MVNEERTKNWEHDLRLALGREAMEHVAPLGPQACGLANTNQHNLNEQRSAQPALSAHLDSVNVSRLRCRALV